MSYNRESHELVEASLQKLIKFDKSTAYPTMVGYLMVNVDLDTAKRIAKLVEEKVGK